MEDVSKQAFLAIIKVVRIIDREKSSATKRDPSLVSYVHYRFSNHSSAKKIPFEEIFKFWEQIRSDDTNTNASEILEKFSWFFFEISTKSIAQHLKETIQWNSDMPPDSKWFKPQFLKNLENILIVLMQQVRNLTDEKIAKELNESIAYFLTDCFPFFEKKFIFDLVTFSFFFFFLFQNAIFGLNYYYSNNLIFF